MKFGKERWKRFERSEGKKWLSHFPIPPSNNLLWLSHLAKLLGFPDLPKREWELQPHQACHEFECGRDDFLRRRRWRGWEATETALETDHAENWRRNNVGLGSNSSLLISFQNIAQLKGCQLDGDESAQPDFFVPIQLTPLAQLHWYWNLTLRPAPHYRTGCAGIIRQHNTALKLVLFFEPPCSSWRANKQLPKQPCQNSIQETIIHHTLKSKTT